MYARIKDANSFLRCGENHPNYGKPINLGIKRKPHTEEQNRKQSERLKGRKREPFTKETREKMRKAKIGVYDGENNPMYGKKRPESLKQKVAERNSRIYQITFPDGPFSP